MKYVYQAVERIPDRLIEGVVYHNKEFELAALLCACGCGHRITLLVPDSHQIISEGRFATIRPSIAVCNATCKSHYYITAGQVEWLPPFTVTQASSVMRSQIARHVALDTKQLSWMDRVRRALIRLVELIKVPFRGKRR